MFQLDLLHTIEQKRDDAINARNALSMRISKEGNTRFLERRLIALGGEINAFNDVLAVMRDQIVSETLEEWESA